MVSGKGSNLSKIRSHSEATMHVTRKAHISLVKIIIAQPKQTSSPLHSWRQRVGDPKSNEQTRKQVGSSVGVIISDKMEENLYRKLIHAGFKVAVFPNIDYAVVSSFPLKNQYSLAVAVYRIYPRLKQYIKANRLCAHPIMELYTKDTVFFIAPLSKQFDFYAEEALPVYDGSSSEPEDEAIIDEYECSKCHYHQNALIKQCCCDPMLHSSSCDRRKRAL
ncbi:hypothetical protein AVEN_137947-1 [Araneus ventricosus]|uniref:Uncharacterized protein n=1 Tax=Araneus ventricosus TaxID=182803 RepID=A0A4Y2GUS8_ARAVE|nr:hypothetical protein AVEN_137947-1 [Araneus ventricosus]